MEIFSVYVKHPKTLPADVFVQMLSLCGDLLRWKPMMDPSTNTAKNFGFAEYTEIQVVARVKRVLSNLPLSPWSINIDKSTLAKLEAFNRTNGVDRSQDASIYAQIQDLIKPYVDVSHHPMDKSQTAQTQLKGAEDFLDTLMTDVVDKNEGRAIGSTVAAINFDDEEQLQRSQDDRKAELEKMYYEVTASLCTFCLILN
jgi:hypothetical protein